MLKPTICISKIIKIFLIIILIIIARILFDEIRFYNQAECFFNKNKILMAVDYYEYSIDAYLPFSPISNKSISKLLNIGKNYEQKQELKKALYVYENLRSSFLQARSFYIPHKNLVKRLDKKIAFIKANLLIEEKKCSNYSKCFKNFLNNSESYKNDISVFWSFISCFSFILWIISIIFLIFSSFKSKKFLFLLVLSLIFFLLWIIGLYLA